MVGPTETQSKVLAFVSDRIKDGAPPSYQEISSYFGWASHAAAAHHVLALEKKGLIHRRAGHRGLAIKTPA